jgi:hypothetical protein
MPPSVKDIDPGKTNYEVGENEKENEKVSNFGYGELVSALFTKHPHDGAR